MSVHMTREHMRGAMPALSYLIPPNGCQRCWKDMDDLLLEAIECSGLAAIVEREQIRRRSASGEATAASNRRG